jgi:hypothetical protein
MKPTMLVVVDPQLEFEEKTTCSQPEINLILTTVVSVHCDESLYCEKKY